MKQAEITVENVFKNVKSRSTRLRNKYAFLGVPEKDFDEFLMAFIKKTFSKAKGKNYVKFTLKELDRYFTSKIGVILNDRKEAVILVNNIFNQILNLAGNDLKTLIDSIGSLDKTFIMARKYPSCEILEYVLTGNSDMYNAIEKLYNKYSTEITSGNLSTISDSYFLEIIIDCYCSINNIVITESIDEEEQEDYDVMVGNGVDSIKQYFQEISRYPLLSSMEEYELAKKYQSGDEEAKKDFANCNLRLVVSVAKKYINTGVNLLDIIQSGNEGLMKAIDRFDPDLGYKFSTYALWWIRQSIRRDYFDTSRLIRLPSYFFEAMKQYKAQVDELTKNGHEYSQEELSEMLNIPLDKIKAYDRWSKDTVSLQTLVGDEEDTTLEEFIPDEKEGPEEEVMSNVILRDQVKAVIDTVLTKREGMVIRKRMGFEGRCYTLDEIGKEQNVSRERIRQIEAKAIRKLRMSKEGKQLKVFY